MQMLTGVIGHRPRAVRTAVGHRSLADDPTQALGDEEHLLLHTHMCAQSLVPTATPPASLLLCIEFPYLLKIGRCEGEEHGDFLCQLGGTTEPREPVKHIWMLL